MAIDRNKLRYLNALEGLNCMYCSYANGLLAYVVEIAGRSNTGARSNTRAVFSTPTTGIRICLAYGDASAYRERIDKVRDDFKDLKDGK